WYMESAESVCPDCSRGCRTRVDTHSNVVRRFKPLHNAKVNGWWMCDDGRTSWKRFYEDRVEGPSTTQTGARRVTTIQDALEAAAEAIEGARADDGGIAVVLTPWFTNEDAYLVGKLLTGPLSNAAVYLGGRPEGQGDDILRQADSNPNRTGTRAVLEALGVSVRPLDESSFDRSSVALVFGDQHALSEQQMQALGGLDARIVFGTRISPLWHTSTVFLPTRIPVEKDGTFTNFEGVVQRIERAVTPARTCKSDGWYAMKLGQALGQDLGFGTPEAVFCAIAEAVPGFHGMRWQALRPTGQVFGEASEPTSPPTPTSAPAGGVP
ncbi:MAG: molybdopterin-dependent oxidoreductase, partial [Myxococcota bacterium]|nr:molybdopterin-dependent oxidoreductase [Myxococcota bacterium]